MAVAIRALLIYTSMGWLSGTAFTIRTCAPPPALKHPRVETK
jgi:hypothetical protein